MQDRPTADRGAGRADDSCGMWEAGPPAEYAAGEWIGPYQVREALGEGAFGVVYLAEQREPVAREVAVKVLKLGMDTRRVIARFDIERQVLARLDHPGVAMVFDAGSTESGRPYFVMEHVPGQPITQYCDRRRMEIDDRLDLFIQVCEAVQHAHQKGVIHRDIKSSNVLVMERDGRPQPKVIDFGMAKGLSVQTPYPTEDGRLIGTPEYMSPEQASIDAGADVDTRSDIYSLGVLLYELLCGLLPRDSDRLRRSTPAELYRVISQEPATAPSARIDLNDEAWVMRAARRATTPYALRRQLKADLDWIVMMAINPEVVRRYPTVSAFIEDLRAFRRGAPVAAGPPSLWYRTKKMMARHSTPLAGAGAALVVGLVLIALQVRGAYRQLEIQEEKDHEAARRGVAVDTADSILRSLSSDEPAAARLAMVEQAIEKASGLVTESGAEASEGADIEPRLRAQYGRVLLEKGERQAAEAQFTEAIAAATRFRSVNGLTPDGERAEAAARRSLAQIRVQQAHEASSEGAIDRASTLSQEAESEYRTAIAYMEQRGSAVEAASLQLELAAHLLHQDRRDASLALVQSAAAGLEDASRGAEWFSNMQRAAELAAELGRHTRAQAMFDQLFAARAVAADATSVVLHQATRAVRDGRAEAVLACFEGPETQRGLADHAASRERLALFLRDLIRDIERTKLTSPKWSGWSAAQVERLIQVVRTSVMPGTGTGRDVLIASARLARMYGLTRTAAAVDLELERSFRAGVEGPLRNAMLSAHRSGLDFASVGDLEAASAAFDRALRSGEAAMDPTSLEFITVIRVRLDAARTHMGLGRLDDADRLLEESERWLAANWAEGGPVQLAECRALRQRLEAMR